MRKFAILLVILVLTGLSHAQADATASFVNNNSATLHGDSSAETQIGQLRITTEVTVTAANDEYSEIEIVGYVPTEQLPLGGPIYTNTLDLIEISSEIAPEYLEIGEVDGDYTRVTLTGWISNDFLAIDRQEMFSHAATIYQSYCSRCHTGYAGPVEQLVERLEPREWPTVAKQMSMGTGISDADLSLVVHWLQNESQIANQD